MPKRITTLLLALLVIALIIAGVLFVTSRHRGPLNLLLISVDTLRPDHMGYEGHRRPTSPHIDQLASEGVVFRNNYSAAGWTLPAIATMMTGHYPRDHGATDFHWAMSPALPTLAGVLRRRGYDTRGYVSHVILQPRYGVAEGFDRYDYSVLSAGHPHEVATGAMLTDLVIRELPVFREPYFLWVHYFDPHFEYLSHPQWSDFGNSIIGRYDQEIAHTDQQIGRLLEALDQHGLLDNTTVVFTSDHGEEFGEHGSQYHYTLYEEVMRVPLVIKSPGLAPDVVLEPTEQVDLLPTLLPLLGVEAGAAGPLPGRDLFADDVSPDAQRSRERPIFLERDRPPPYNQRGVIRGRYKLSVIEYADTSQIPTTSRGTYIQITNVHPGIYMYDLETDPLETKNIYSQDRPEARQLLALLAEHFSGANKPVRQVGIDEDLQRKLRSLGYIR